MYRDGVLIFAASSAIGDHSYPDLHMFVKVHRRPRLQERPVSALSDQQRLTTTMNARRVALRLHWDEVAARADISVTHLRRIRKGEYLPSPLIQSKLEEALRWDRGSIQHILDGDDPIELDGPASVTVEGTSGNVHMRAGQGSVQTDDGLQAAIRELARRLPPEDVRALLEEFTDAEPSGENPYTDPQERRIWEITGIPETMRANLIVWLRGLRATEGMSTPTASRETRTLPAGEVREFRQRG
jgi:hypothetical protein